MTLATRKDPSAVLDWAFDWSAWLDDDETITSHTVTAESGITKNSDSATEGVVTVWLSGGTDDADYTVTCRVTTSAGRTDERSITIQVRDR